MKHIPSNNPLETYGVNILTGEACVFGMRLLCDLNKQGAELMCDYFGLGSGYGGDKIFASQWNSTVNNAPAVASIMLPREIFPSLIRFALWREGFQYIVTHDGGWACTGLNDSDVETNPLLKTYLNGDLREGVQLLRNPRLKDHPVEGTRAVHAMTGRAA